MMATNGQDHNEALASVERAITGSRLAMQPTQNLEPADENSITGFAESLADQYRALARHALEHGNYLSQAIPKGDFPAIIGVTLLLGVMYVVVNTVVDILQAMADPRIRS